jgi:hypothetical protein
MGKTYQFFVKIFFYRKKNKKKFIEQELNFQKTPPKKQLRKETKNKTKRHYMVNESHDNIWMTSILN